MPFFGWRLTNKQPIVESEAIKELHLALKIEQDYRKEALEIAKTKEAKLKVLLSKAELEQSERQKKLTQKNKKQATAHLKIAERYYEQMSQTSGARHSELKSIVDNRLEKAKNLGFNVKGSITQTINGMMK